MSLFNNLMGLVPKVGRAEIEVVVASVSLKKEDRTFLSTSGKLKLLKSAQEGRGADIFPSSKLMEK